MERRRDIARLFAQRYTIKGELSPQSMEWLTNILIPMRVLKGTMLLNEGEVCKYFYYLDRGLLRQVYKKKGQLLTEHIGYEGSIVNMGVKNPDGSLCYVIGVKKTIRQALGKGDGERIHVVILEREG